jgi:hypothetical protein
MVGRPVDMNFASRANLRPDAESAVLAAALRAGGTFFAENFISLLWSKRH